MDYAPVVVGIPLKENENEVNLFHPQKLSKKTDVKFIREKEPEVVSELRKESDKHQKAKKRAF